MYAPATSRCWPRLARPSIGVVTAVRGTHLARAGSIDAIERGKRELVEALPAGGTAVLNADDARVARMASHVGRERSRDHLRLRETADVTRDRRRVAGAEGMRFRLQTRRRRARGADPGARPAQRPQRAGRGGRRPRRRAWTSMRSPAASLASCSAPHRTTLLDMGAIRVLDDSYNAAPDSMIAALDLLASLPGRHVAVLGEMLELGDASAEQSTAASARTPLERPTWSSSPGPWRPITPTARADGQSHRSRAVSARSDRARSCEPGDVVLIKGSRGAAMDELLPVLERAAKRHEGTGRVSIAAPLVQAILLAFALVVILMPPFIVLLRGWASASASAVRRPRLAHGQGRHADDGRRADDRRRRRLGAALPRDRHDRRVPGPADDRAAADAASSSASWARPTTT